MLIGGNVPEAQVHKECRKGKGGEPNAVGTMLGWAVLGPVDAVSSLNSHKVNVNFLNYDSELSDQQMEQFLRLETLTSTRVQSRECQLKTRNRSIR